MRACDSPPSICQEVCEKVNTWHSHTQLCTLQSLPGVEDGRMQDEMLPPVMMRELFQAAEAAKLTPCTWVEFEHAHHMDAHLIAQAVSSGMMLAATDASKWGPKSMYYCCPWSRSPWWVWCGSPPGCLAADCT